MRPAGTIRNGGHINFLTVPVHICRRPQTHEKDELTKLPVASEYRMELLIMNRHAKVRLLLPNLGPTKS